VELIPVLDVRQGRAVRAGGGDRSRYPPLASVLAYGSDPRDLARACREGLAADQLYVADLDAIAGYGTDVRPAAALVETLARDGTRVWIDAGAGQPEACRQLLEAGAARVVVGLETLPDLASLGRLPERLGPDALAFSLDLKDGRPLARSPDLTEMGPRTLARAALAAGYRAIIVLDLDRVGSRKGPGLDLLGEERRRAAGTRWVSGGGVRGAADLRALAAAGWDACLVGSALHDGSIGDAELRAAAGCERLSSSTRP
jgi:phosphoribosylformimino-5-aminoimidazole carboxamide ribotide isomerase